MKAYHITIPDNLSPRPSYRELSAAYILMEYFQSDIEFVVRNLQKSADYKICNQFWELKSPTGAGKHNIQHSLQAAAKQSANVVLDLRFSKLNSVRAISEAKRQVQIIRRIKRLLVIEKSQKVIEIHC